MRNYPLNDVHIPVSFKELVNYAAEAYSDKPAFCELNKQGQRQVSFIQFKAEIEALGTYFYYKGWVNKKIVVIGENSYYWILSYFIAVLCSDIIIPLDKELPKDEIRDLLERCNADVLIYSDMYSDITEMAGRADFSIVFVNMKTFDGLIAEGRSLLAGGDTRFVESKTDVNAVCTVIFTSGTTGQPKGVMLSQKNLLSDAAGACQYVYAPSPSLLTLPLNHAFAFTAGVLGTFNNGITVCINNSLWSFLSDMKRFKPKTMFVVPFYIENMYKMIWQTAKKRKRTQKLKILIFASNLLRLFGLDLRRKLFSPVLKKFGGELELFISGGAYLDERYIKFFGNIGITVLNGYGITECAPVVSVNRNRQIVKNSVGTPLTCNQIKTVDGEIYVRGDNVTLGYYEDEAAAREAFEEGWFKTGDLGYIKGSRLFITGRKKNLIILSNGRNVSPEELEAYLLRIPEVKETAVYSDGDLITAEIYGQHHDKIKSEITKLNKMLPAYKQIQKLVFRESEFDKTTTRKIKRTKEGRTAKKALNKSDI